MRMLAGGAGWLMRGGIVRWLVAAAILILVGSVLLPHLGRATQTVFAAAVVAAVLLVVFRLLVGGRGRR